MIKNIKDLLAVKEAYNKKMASYKHIVLICSGTSCVAGNCKAVHDALIDELEKNGLTDEIAVIEHGGCMGTCAVGPIVYVLPDETYYTEMNASKIREIVKEHFIDGVPAERYTFYDTIQRKRISNIKDIAFFKDQVRIALRNCGLIDVNCIDSYIAKDGYFALAKALEKGDRLGVIEELKKSGLRGRGGGGFPTGRKWEAGYNAKEGQKYIICNADEGDPGAFMDRSVFEGDPHTVIEGMIIGGYAIGADKGFVYIRAEYPLAIRCLTTALEQAREVGLLGENILGSGFNFDIEIRIGAGAFVCGEETALMSSVEGQRGEPKQKPPFPFQKGLYGYPTIICNVETFANVPPILLNGADWFRQYGTPESPGTKVFALSGNIVNSGLVEVPMGMPVANVVFDIGAGILGEKKFKSAQTGGPSGGCITPEYLNTPLDYNSLISIGTMIGSGGLIAMDEDTCMVDTARFYLEFIQEESCGKCTPCRIGTKRMLEILENITRGKGKPGDIDKLIELGETIKKTAMCGLGQTAPNPVLSTIKYFREEYEEHINKGYCRAGVCSELFISPCENACPANINIPGYLSLIAAGRFVDAYDLIRQENPMPAICGRVCTHPCEKKCRRGTVDEPLDICKLKRFVSDYAMKNKDKYSEEIIFPKNGKYVSVIGAGAAGLTCAYYLSRLGYEVDVYESQPVAGGVLAYGIPEYRLPADVLEREIEEMKRSGFNIHLNTEVGKDISFDSLKEKSDAIFVGTGTSFPQKVNIPGEDIAGVYPGIDFLKDVKLYNKIDFTGDEVVVIGGGNTAIDASRTAVRLGAKKVTIIYRRTKDTMPAESLEIKEAVDEGVEIVELVSPVRFIANKDGNLCQIECVHRKFTNFDKQGRRNSASIDGSNFLIDADKCIVAVSQYADLPFIKKGKIGQTPWGTFITDPDTLMTTMEGVFAGGDVVRGPNEVVQAVADGKNAAASIDRYLGGTGELNKGRHIAVPVIKDDDEVIIHNRFGQSYLPIDSRVCNFEEVEQGYHKLNAIAEAMRCLHCDRR